MICELGFVTTIKCYLVWILAVYAQGDQEEAHHEEGVRDLFGKIGQLYVLFNFAFDVMT